MSEVKTFFMTNGDNLDIIKDWIQQELDKNKGSTFKAIKVSIIDERNNQNIFEFANENW